MPLHPPSNSCLTGPIYFGVGLPHAAVRTPSALHTHLQNVRSNLQCDFVVIPTAAFSPEYYEALPPSSPVSSSSSPASSSSSPASSSALPASSSVVPNVRASIPVEHLPEFAAHPEKQRALPSASLASFASCSFRGVDGGLSELPVSVAFSPSTGSDLALDSQTWASSVVCELSPWIAPDKCLRPPQPSVCRARDSLQKTLEVAFPSPALSVSPSAGSSASAALPPQVAHWSFHAAAWQREMQWATHVGAYAVIAPAPLPGDAPIEYARQLKAAFSQLQPPSVWVRLPLLYPRRSEASAAAPRTFDDPWQQWRLIRAFVGHNAALGVCLEVTEDLPDEEELARWLAEPVRALLISPAIFTCATRAGDGRTEGESAGVASRRGRASQDDDEHRPGAAAEKKTPEGREALAGTAGRKSDAQSVALSPRHFAFLVRCAEHRVKIIFRQEEETSGCVSSDTVDLASAQAFPALGEARPAVSTTAFSVMDLQPYLSHLVARFLQLPTLSPAALFSAPYRDVLQSPMQPLADNLSTMNYEVFEKDPVKYVRYRQATLRRLREIWTPTRAASETERPETPQRGGAGVKKPKKSKKKSRASHSCETDSDFAESWSEDESCSSAASAYTWCLNGEDCPDHGWLPETFPGGGRSRLVIMVVGAGRGPLVQSALDALKEAQIPLCRVHLYAVEKNCNATVTLRARHQGDPCEGWRAVRVVESDMREVGQKVSEKADILISELLGSFGDNELSVECLHGAQKLLRRGGISIPTAYVSSVEPVSASKLWTAIDSYGDAKHFESPYVVDFFAVYRPGAEGPLECFHFKHPEALLPFADDEEQTREGDQATETQPRSGPSRKTRAERNAETSVALQKKVAPSAQQLTLWRHRRTRLAWHMKADAVVHGLAGYFHCCLYKDVYISIDPRSFSEGMFSWFPLFLPFRVPVYVQRGAELEVYLAREGDEHRVWYEWAVMQPQQSDIYNHLGKHYFIGK
ncbi:histone arginine methyltransferase PRMT5 [Toxoplasma gondii GT1]|uniref:Histone arginine methyltransferase PRMT5 n=2 Tax=Toxoplasma gondii TaxID=5811 RepID=S7UQT1_TOXGG|nr:histone arginine methyltransferase PRMT5 [Toxoplasma gondii GT1]KAF4639980.1 histone arginine methyltransferase PRMT5 [Toxoplasma gondii]